MSRSISAKALQNALDLLGLDDLSVSEAVVKSKRTAAAKTTHPDLFSDELEKKSANDLLSRVNEACDLLLECLEFGILPRLPYPPDLNDLPWQPGGDEKGSGRHPQATARSKSKRTTKTPPAWVRDEYRLFLQWRATVEHLTVERMDREWRRRLVARSFEENLRKRREAEAAEKLRQEAQAEQEASCESQKRENAERTQTEKRARRQAEAAARKLARQKV